MFSHLGVMRTSPWGVCGDSETKNSMNGRRQQSWIVLILKRTSPVTPWDNNMGTIR